ncbi:MAG: phosphonopyruvate decarboxylase [Rhodospirillaceae bacterium]
MPDDNSHAEWSKVLYELFSEAGVTLYPYIPDAGNKALIEIVEGQNDARAVLLTSEEEGVAVCAGADLVGQKGLLCMQSSGVGNIPNFLSFSKGGHFPVLMMVSMRGDYGEQNPWQYPMGQAAIPVLEAMGVLCFTVERRDELEKAATAAINAAFRGGQAAALILSQKFLGAKAF